ncbi:MAG: YceI family protein [Pirellulales bacterium]
MTARTTFSILASLSALLSTSRPALAADAYNIDPAHTSIVFSVGHAGLSYTYGIFREASGGYILDANPANCRFQLTIQTNSLDTNHAKRDDHLRSADFFNVQQFPTITFESTGCTLTNTPDRSIVYQVAGNLTVHGVTRPVTVPLRLLAEGKGPYGDARSGFLCQLELKRSDYGMTNLLENNLVGDAVSVTISFEGVKQEPGAQQRPR